MAKQPEHPSLQTGDSQGAMFDVVVSREGGGLTEPTEPTGNFSYSYREPSIGDIADQPVSEVESEVTSTDVRARARLLIGALDSLAQSNKYKGFAEVRTPAAGRDDNGEYGVAQLEEMKKRTATNPKRGIEQAKDSFLQAFNLGLTVPVSKKDRTFVREFDRFMKNYGVGQSPKDTAEKRKHRDSYRKALGKVVTAEYAEAPEPVINLDMKTGGLPEAASVKAAPKPSIPIVTPEHLKTHEHSVTSEERLKIAELKRSWTAGFIPTSRKELDMAHRIHSKDTQGYLDSIFYGTQKQYAGRDKLTHAQQAAKSITNVMVDFRNSAETSFGQLKFIEEVIEGVSDHAGLARLVAGNEASATPLIRYLDFQALLKDGVEPRFDMLRSHENRKDKSDPANKTVQDPYAITGSEALHVADHLRQRLEKLSVADARAVLLDAKLDQSNRRLFWRKSLDALEVEYPTEVASARTRLV